jgi:hypothetical protein
MSNESVQTKRGLQLDQVVLLGRTFEEYRRYFLLEPTRRVGLETPMPARRFTETPYNTSDRCIIGRTVLFARRPAFLVRACDRHLPWRRGLAACV